MEALISSLITMIIKNKHTSSSQGSNRLIKIVKNLMILTTFHNHRLISAKIHCHDIFHRNQHSLLLDSTPEVRRRFYTMCFKRDWSTEGPKALGFPFNVNFLPCTGCALEHSKQFKYHLYKILRHERIFIKISPVTP